MCSQQNYICVSIPNVYMLKKCLTWFEFSENSCYIILLRRPWIWKPLLILCQGEWKVASRPNSRPGNLFPLPNGFVGKSSFYIIGRNCCGRSLRAQSCAKARSEGRKNKTVGVLLLGESYKRACWNKLSWDRNYSCR